MLDREYWETLDMLPEDHVNDYGDQNIQNRGHRKGDTDNDIPRNRFDSNEQALM